jgi:hypothetical protein
VVVVARGTALRTPARYFVFSATRRLSNAPQADKKVNGKFVPIYRVGQTVRLVAKLPANQTFRMFIRDGSKWYSVGSGLSDPTGRLSMVAFRATQAKEYAYKFVSTSTGRTFYVKVNLAGPR